MNSELPSWNLPLGRVAGIRVELHWILLVWWLYDLNDLWELGISRALVLGLWAVQVGLTFGCIVLHELGHCFAARSSGGEADRVLLWPLGGLAYVSAPQRWRAQLLVAAGGPIVNAAIALVAWPATWLLESAFPGLGKSIWWLVARDCLIRLNLVLLIFNCLPLYPLDGGRMFHSLAWGWYERAHGPGSTAHFRAAVLTVWVTRVLAAGALVWAIYVREWMLLFLLVWVWMGAESWLRHLSESWPYTLPSWGTPASSSGVRSGAAERRRAAREGLLARLRSRLQSRGSSRRAPRRDEPPAASAADEQRLDELLAKIHDRGMGALSPGERDFLQRMSRRKNG